MGDLLEYPKGALQGTLLGFLSTHIVTVCILTGLVAFIVSNRGKNKQNNEMDRTTTNINYITQQNSKQFSQDNQFITTKNTAVPGEGSCTTQLFEDKSVQPIVSYIRPHRPQPDNIKSFTGIVIN